MKNLRLLFLLLAAGALVYACQPAQKEDMTAENPDAPVAVTMTKADSVKRGEYL